MLNAPSSRNYPSRALSSRRYAVFVPSLAGGGAQKVVVSLVNSWAGSGVAVDLVLGIAEGPFLPEVSPSVRIVDLKSPGVLGSLPGLIRYLNRERPRAMMSVMSHTNIAALIARKVAVHRFRLVVSERNSLQGADFRSSALRQRVIRWLMPRLYPNADAITVVADAMRAELSEFLGADPASVVAIPNPAPGQESVSVLAAQPAGHPWLELRACPVILGVGRLTAQKDFTTLIDAFARVRAVRPARLILLGEGEDRAALAKRIAEAGLGKDIDMPGFVDNPYAFLARCDVFVLSSRWEGFPNVLIQAMACGAAVVSTDCPTGPREILAGGQWGALVPVGDAAAMAAAILHRLDTPERPDVRRRAEDYSLRSIARSYLSVLDGA